MKTAVATILIVWVVVGSWFAADTFLFSQQRMERAQLLQKIVERSCVHNELEQIAKQGDYRKKYEAILNTELMAIEKKIPPVSDDSGLLALLSRLAEQNKVQLHHFQIEKPRSQNTWFELPVTLVLSASFPELVGFLKSLTEQERLMVVEDLKYGPTGVEVRLVTYFGNWHPKHEVVGTLNYGCGESIVPANLDLVLRMQESVKAIPALAHNPFIVPEIKLHLVGVIQQEDDWVALLEDDRGEGRVVQVGDALTEGFVVKYISKNSVSLSDGNLTQHLTWSN